jgi:hypothetical protein
MEEEEQAKQTAHHFNNLTVKANRSEELNQKDIADLNKAIKTHE